MLRSCTRDARVCRGGLRWESTGSHHEYKPGPLTRALRSVFVTLAPSNVKKRIAGRLHTNLSQVQRLEEQQQWIKVLGSPLRVLGLPEHADLDDVKARYKDLLFETHPDTAVAAARRAGVKDIESMTAGTGGAGGALVAQEGMSDADVKALAVQRFELLVKAYKIATDPTSVWHRNGSAPQIYRELEAPSLLGRVATPTATFGLISYAIAAVVMALLYYVVVPRAWERALEFTFPDFYQYMKQREEEDAELRAQGIEPRDDGLQFASQQVRLQVAPGRELLDPTEQEAEAAKAWKPQSSPK